MNINHFKRQQPQWSTPRHREYTKLFSNTITRGPFSPSQMKMTRYANIKWGISRAEDGGKTNLPTKLQHSKLHQTSNKMMQSIESGKPLYCMGTEHKNCCKISDHNISWGIVGNIWKHFYIFVNKTCFKKSIQCQINNKVCHIYLSSSLCSYWQHKFKTSVFYIGYTWQGTIIIL